MRHFVKLPSYSIPDRAPAEINRNIRADDKVSPKLSKFRAHNIESLNGAICYLSYVTGVDLSPTPCIATYYFRNGEANFRINIPCACRLPSNRTSKKAHGSAAGPVFYREFAECTFG